MRSHEALKAAIGKPGPKAVAAELKVSPSLLYKWMEPAEEEGGSGAANPLDRLVVICRMANDATPVRWLCAQVGGFFVQNPAPLKAEAVKLDVLVETQRMLREFSDVLNAVSRGAEDGALSAEDAARIRREWDELKSIGEAFVVACEAAVPPAAPKKKR